MTRSEAPDPRIFRQRSSPKRRPAKAVRSPTRRVITCTSRRRLGASARTSRRIVHGKFHGGLRHGPLRTDFPPTQLFFEGNSSALQNPQLKGTDRGAHASRAHAILDRGPERAKRDNPGFRPGFSVHAQLGALNGSAVKDFRVTLYAGNPFPISGATGEAFDSPVSSSCDASIEEVTPPVDLHRRKIGLALNTERQSHWRPKAVASGPALTLFSARKTQRVQIGVPRPRLCVGVRIRLTFEDTPTQSRGRGTQKGLTA